MTAENQNTNHDIAAGIVLYNPQDRNRLTLCLQSVFVQVDQIYIFDNSTEIFEFTYPRKVTYISEHNNKGIAYALNRIMETARKDGYQWVVTLD